MGSGARVAGGDVNGCLWVLGEILLENTCILEVGHALVRTGKRTASTSPLDGQDPGFCAPAWAHSKGRAV